MNKLYPVKTSTSMNKQGVVAEILKDCAKTPKHEKAVAFAPSNIALCKYWGKRNSELNLPVTSSLSISLGIFGATTALSVFSGSEDRISVNGEPIPLNSVFGQNLTGYLNLFRSHPSLAFDVETSTNIPIAAGLASSACGFAATALALDQLFDWQLSKTQLSILGRLGSGSASRSFWSGFVEWEAGIAENGMDSFGKVLPEVWPELRLGLLILNSKQKSVSSRIAMQNSVLTSPFYEVWPKKQAQDLQRLKVAIHEQDFITFGETAESNALAMHSLLLSASPAFLYSEPETIFAMKQIWQARMQGLSVYFTQDAGPNIKLIFLEKDTTSILALFPELQIVLPFEQKSVPMEVLSS